MRIGLSSPCTRCTREEVVVMDNCSCCLCSCLLSPTTTALSPAPTRWCYWCMLQLWSSTTVQDELTSVCQRSNIVTCFALIPRLINSSGNPQTPTQINMENDSIRTHPLGTGCSLCEAFHWLLQGNYLAQQKMTAWHGTCILNITVG